MMSRQMILKVSTKLEKVNNTILKSLILFLHFLIYYELLVLIGFCNYLLHSSYFKKGYEEL